MQRRAIQLSFLILLSMIGCTDSRKPKISQGIRMGRAPAQGLVAVAEVKFDQKDTVSLQMMTKGPSLFLTGRPFGFSRWDVGADPEVPHLTFAMSDQIDTFSPKAPWTPDWYAGGAIGVLGPFALTSGAIGASLVSLSDTANPVEIRRYPPFDEKESQPVQDPNFAYKAIAVNPNLPIFYGFREQDFVATLLLQGSDVKIVSKAGYSDGGTCCVMGATVYQNEVFVAFRSSVWMFGMKNDGNLDDPTHLNIMNAVNIASTGQYLYVQHQPVSSSTGASKPAGIYVFNAQGDSIAFLPITPRKFTVAQDDSHIYANMDDTSIRIYRIDWNNLTGGN